MPETETHSESTAQFTVGCSAVCDVVRKPTRRKRRSRSFHKILGLIAAIPLVWVLLTGVLLNHSEDLGLDETELTSPLILSAYGMTPSGEPLAIRVGNHTITQWDGITFFNRQQIEIEGELVTAFSVGEEIALVSDLAVIRLNGHGEVIERLDELSLPDIPIEMAATAEGKMNLFANGRWFTADDDWITFTESTTPDDVPTLVALKDEKLKGELFSLWAGDGVSLSRFVLDLHAGNFLGPVAAYFYDFVALCTLWLIGTGLILQYRSGRRNRLSC